MVWEGRSRETSPYPDRRGFSVQSRMSLEYWIIPAFAADDGRDDDSELWRDFKQHRLQTRLRDLAAGLREVDPEFSAF